MHALPLAMALLVSAPPVPDARGAFEVIKKLEGSWKTDGKSGPVQYVTIRIVADGSAVLETTTNEGRTSLTSVTIYALEGSDLVATNHGPGGASRLKVYGGANDVLRFDGAVKDAKVAALSLVVKDNKLRQEWTVRENGRDVRKSIDLLREYVDTLK